MFLLLQLGNSSIVAAINYVRMTPPDHDGARRKKSTSKHAATTKTTTTAPPHHWLRLAGCLVVVVLADCVDYRRQEGARRTSLALRYVQLLLQLVVGGPSMAALAYK
jgi:hypothetical protein